MPKEWNKREGRREDKLDRKTMNRRLFGGDGPWEAHRHEEQGKRKPYREQPEKDGFKKEGVNKAIPKKAAPVKQMKERAGEGLDLIEGRNPVLEALKAGRTINKLLVSRGDREGSIKQITALAREKRIVVQEVDRTKLDNISVTQSHQGVIAFAAVKEYVEVEDILKAAEAKGETPFVIILDEITDSHNLGSILRSADAVGAHGIIIPKRRAAGLTSAVAKASAGAVEYVPVARVTNLSNTIEALKKNNIWVVGTDQRGEKPFYKSDLKGPIALVIGSEGEGMGRLIKEKCDFVVSIPMKGCISSLNAAVAGAIVMYEIAKQRKEA